MNCSQTIGKLSDALSKAQAKISGAIKGSDNPFFKSKYADLSEVWNACREPLTSNGLAIIQTMFAPENPEFLGLETILSHASGEWVSSSLTMKPVKNDPQSVGSCITYMRRYSLAAITGVAPEDDDGNAASGKGEPESKNAQADKQPKPKTDTPKSKADPKPTPEDLTEEKDKFDVLCKEMGLSTEDVAAFKKFLFKKAPTKAELQDVIEHFYDKYDEFVNSQPA